MYTPTGVATPVSPTATLSTTTTLITYDAADELTASITSPQGFVGLPLASTYTYDADGNQLSSVTITGPSTNGTDG